MIEITLSLTIMMRAATLFSGGKDSVYATYIAMQQCIDVQATITVLPYHDDSLMFHVPNVRFAPLISSVMGLPNISVEMRKSDDELESLKALISSLDIDAIVTGAIASDYQASRINDVCERLGLKVFSPFWHKNEEMLLRDMLNAGFRVLIIGAFAENISVDWLGRELDSLAIDELLNLSRESGIHIGGEGGEIETIVFDGPNFKKALEITSSSIFWKKNSGFLRINALRLFEKT